MNLEFIAFAKEGGYSADEMREAYYRLYGVSENEQANPANVEKILSKMKEMTDSGYPFNGFKKLIGVKETLEKALPAYREFLDTLKISDKEKEVLRSIAERKRNGDIDCFVEGNLSGSFSIGDGDGSTEMRVYTLMEEITNIVRRLPKGKKYEFAFTEK